MRYGVPEPVALATGAGAPERPVMPVATDGIPACPRGARRCTKWYHEGFRMPSWWRCEERYLLSEGPNSRTKEYQGYRVRIQMTKHALEAIEGRHGGWWSRAFEDLYLETAAEPYTWPGQGFKECRCDPLTRLPFGPPAVRTTYLYPLRLSFPTSPVRAPYSQSCICRVLDTSSLCGTYTLWPFVEACVDPLVPSSRAVSIVDPSHMRPPPRVAAWRFSR